MPNWCAGTLRVRGTKENLTKFVLEGLQPVNYIGEGLETLKMNDYSEVKCSRCWIKGTRRGFILDLDVFIDDLNDEGKIAIGLEADDRAERKEMYCSRDVYDGEDGKYIYGDYRYLIESEFSDLEVKENE